jgi:hypothetical protein
MNKVKWVSKKGVGIEEPDNLIIVKHPTIVRQLTYLGKVLKVLKGMGRTIGVKI